MAYSTTDDIKKLLPETILRQLTDDENAGAVNEARVAEAVAQADAEIDSYCGTKYAVPFAAPAPEIVQKISVDIAIYNLYSRKVEEAPPVRSERYKNAIRQLEGIGKGTISIGIDPAPAAPSQGAPETNVSESARVFTRDKLSGF